nr:MAG TPA: baseplate protein [Caudoviricetes sp.]
MAFQTEYEFTLPRGYLDNSGTLHKEGVMRLATAADEILPLKDPRVQQNPGYLTVILLARVITRLGGLPAVDTRVIENLYTADLAYLQDLYEKVNSMEAPSYKTVCPRCSQEITVPVNFMDAGI